jgi:hypothetical protein
VVSELGYGGTGVEVLRAMSVEDPLKSGVHLRDGRLQLLEIMRQKISNSELAFLSAFQTSKGDVKLSEEVDHLNFWYACCWISWYNVEYF